MPIAENDIDDAVAEARYWLLTVWAKVGRPEPVPHEGRLAEYAKEFPHEPIVFAAEITEAEYRELMDLL